MENDGQVIISGAVKIHKEAFVKVLDLTYEYIRKTQGEWEEKIDIGPTILRDDFFIDIVGKTICTLLNKFLGYNGSWDFVSGYIRIEGNTNGNLHLDYLKSIADVSIGALIVREGSDIFKLKIVGPTVKKIAGRIVFPDEE